MARAARLGVALAAALAVLVAVPVSAGDHLPPGGTFFDDDGNTHEAFIETIAAAGVTVGCNVDGTRYCPKDVVTRAQMASFLARALGLPIPATDYFDDDADSIHQPNINAIAEAGITVGCTPNRQFCPEDLLTRAQMASFLARALSLPTPATDYFDDDEDSIHQPNINAIAEAGITVGCTPNREFCPEVLLARDQMASFLGRALGLTPIVPPPPATPTLRLVASGLSGPLFLTAPAGDDRLFIVEKGGFIAIVEAGTLLPQKFLDVSALIAKGSEQGLLGMAFHPDYAANGLFYVSYTNTDGNSIVVEYEVSAGDPNAADPASARTIIRVDQPHRWHNGGMIAFDDDGYLYLGLGDGGPGNDPNEEAQNPLTLLGSLLRLDVAGDDFPGDPDRNYRIPPDNPFASDPSGAPEVWAYGLRNPWRWSFDRDLLFIGDVGQWAREEISVAPADAAPLNYGWDTLEGSLCHEPSSGCSSQGTVLPALEYSHTAGLVVIGGYVYRGWTFPALVGHYFYGDQAGGWIKSFVYENGAVTDQRDWSLPTEDVWSFGVDAAGELYVMGGTTVYKLAP